MKANTIAAEMTSWAAKDSIRDTGDMIIVKLGEVWIPTESVSSQYTVDAVSVN